MMQLRVLEPRIQPAETVLSGLQLLVDVRDVRAKVGLDILQVFLVSGMARETTAALERSLSAVNVRLIALGRSLQSDRLRFRFEIRLNRREFNRLEGFG